MATISHIITVFLCLMLLVEALYGITGGILLPGQDGFALLVLVLGAYLGGLIVNYFLKLPSLVGMLAVGILFRNVQWPFDVSIPLDLTYTLRSTALVIILLKAGLGLDPDRLRDLKWDILRLSLLPCVLEAALTAVLSRLLLGIPWLWAFMLGFILTAVSAAILIPGALQLEEKQIGTRKGVPTLLMAAVSVDNVVALTGFFILFNILFDEASVGWTLLFRLLEPFLGLVLGAIIGFLFWSFPNKRSDASTVTYYQSLLLCLGGLSFVFLSKRFGASGVGAMGCVSLAFVASIDWRKNGEQFGRIKWITGKLWELIEPFLFSLIGAQITIENLQNNLANNLLILLGGIIMRVLSVFLALHKSQLDLKEKAFVGLTWISKATVQAAVGSEALEFSKTEHKGYEFEDLGKKVLTMSVLVIIITAPLGAIVMDCLERYLLENNKVIINIIPEDKSSHTDNAIPETTYGTCNQSISPV